MPTGWPTACGDVGRRANVLHLPVVGVGDGGITSTAQDLHRFCQVLFAGGIVRSDLVAELMKARTEEVGDGWSYGLGFWLEQGGSGVALEGYDAGVPSPRVPNRAASCVRFLTPVLSKMLDTWRSMVLRDRNRVRAISGLLAP